MAKEDRHEGGVDTIQRKKSKTSFPQQYKVLLLNDDYTTMDFVVSVLEGIFRRSPSEAVQIMLAVHKTGSGVAGIYSKEIAEAKIEATQHRAREAGFPLRCLLEPE